LNHLLKAITTEIAQTKYGDSPVELYDPIEYIMSLGGKKMRPLLTLMAAEMFSDNWQKALKPAIAVEVFHNFTLMHDDIMDDAPLRRGKSTVHEKWNPNIAILSGDVMLVCAYELMLNAEIEKLPHILKRFNRTAAGVCEGQQMDMNFASRNDVSKEEYIEMIRLKTSVLLGFALELGGIIADADQESVNLLYEIGEKIGIGFQLKDDILDVYGDPEKFGKQVGGDIIENKKTWLLIEAMNRATGDTKTELEKWLSIDKSNPPVGGWGAKVEAVTNIYNSLNIRQLADSEMNRYFDLGFAGLQKLNAPTKRKQSVISFVEQLVEREN
jgi:geranylgeranyl diphosphate synthase, type II